LRATRPRRCTSASGPREILALALGLDTAGELHPLAARDSLHDAWVELLDELAAKRPVVVLVEDLHYRAYNNLATVHTALGNLEEAVACVPQGAPTPNISGSGS
jgi:hypothetical protein